MKNYAVRAHSFLLVAAEKLLQAAEVSFGSTQVILPGGRPGYLAVLVFYSIIHLQHPTQRGGQMVEMHIITVSVMESIVTQQHQV